VKTTITIAGGGLAGLSLGIALQQRDVDVLIHEAATYPRHRVCGEFISGVTVECLDRLGIADCLADATRLVRSSWHDEAGLLGKMQVEGRGISRWILDDRLQKKFLAFGGRVATNSRIKPGEGIVWAAGRPRRPGHWIGLKCHAQRLHLDDDLEMFAAANGYIGLAKIEEGKVNICGLFKKNQQPNGKGPAMLLSALRHGGLNDLADRLGSADLDESSFCGVAGFELGRQRAPAFSIGDACTMIPPFTGNGMSMAFESAECALQPALDYAEGRKSWQEAAIEVAAAQAKRFRRRLLVASGLHKLLTTRKGLQFSTSLARRRLIPYQTILQLVR
jgi:flavin-dependent dehydrogenase